MSGRHLPAGSTVRLRRLGQILLVSAIVASTIFSSNPMGASADSGVCAIPGFDGPGGTLSGIVNTYYPGSATAAAGSTSTSVGSPSGSATAIAAGDLLLVIQMQDAEIDSNNDERYGDGSGTAGNLTGVGSGSTNLNNAGRYEYVVASGPVAAGSVPITGDGAGSGLVYTYTDAAATVTQGQRRFQVIRVPQYSTATLSSTLAALAWNGQVGGVLALDVAGQLTLGGTVSVSALGFRGGGARQVGGSAGFLNTDYRTPSTSNPNGAKAEGIAGTPILVYNGTSVVNTGIEGYPNGAMARGAPGNAGGGGTDGNPAANDQNSGGGGGGNGGTGGLGGFTWNTVLSRGGFGGAAFSVAAPDRLVLGAGGGAGTRNNAGVAGASSGGVGGGMVMIRAGTLIGTGSIVANGGTGVAPLNDGGGGGGAGGSVLLTAQTWSPTSLTVNAVGGLGASTWPLQPPGTPGEFTTGSANARHGPGGGGGGGVILLTSAVNTTTDVSGGANGISTTAGSAFGSQPGTAGVVSTTVTDGQVTTGISGVLCLPILTTTKTTSTPAVVNGPGGTSATYAINVTNAAGLGTAIGLSISDLLPSGFTYASTTSVTLTGGATRSPVTNPTVGDSNPTWSEFQLPGGGGIEIVFAVEIASTVADGTYQNPATATYLDPQRSTSGGTTSSSYDSGSSTGEDVTVTSPPTPSLNVVKSESSTGPYGLGDPITYALVVTNSGNVTLTNVTVSDPVATVGVCTPAQPGTLAPSASMTCPATYVVTQADLDAGSFTNTATADSTETGPDTDSETVTFPVVLVIDPAVTKSADPSTASVGDTVVFTLAITNNGTGDAANVVVTDVVPAFLTINNVVVAPAGPSVGIVGNTITIDFGTVTPSDVYTVTITTTVNSSATPPGGTNNVTLATSSLDSDPTNNVDDASITIVVPGLEAPETGFAPGRLTWLPPQPADKTYLDYGDLWLEIPSIGVRISIVGVPQSGGGWDVSWLGGLAGYLGGTAFPTWAGNSVVTAHVTLASGQPGPFENLKSLRFGDRVIVHAWGLRHIYEIREVDLVSPADRGVFRHEERSWLTLVTCHGYDEREDSYRWRVAARSVLVSIEDDEGRAVPAQASAEPASSDRRQPALSGGR